MASPWLESFCCMFGNISDHHHDHVVHHASTFSKTDLNIYNTLCIISSTVSIFGAMYQLWPKAAVSLPRGRKEAESFLRQNAIICWLALADLMASIGILIRSALWLANHIPLNNVDNTGSADFAHYFCAISSGWIQYFYICTYFWTFSYAFETYLISQEKESRPWLYHVACWLLPAVITGGGLIPLYVPALLNCEHTVSHLVPHYLATYVPILLVLVCNPILYTKASTAVRSAVMRRGRYTDAERKILRAVNKQFLLFILVFYLCWLPNIINGFLLMFSRRIPMEVFLGIWQFMAIVNPVQAFLNTLVYRGTGGLHCSCGRSDSDGVNSVNHVQDHTTEESTETSPLLSFRR